MLLRADGGLRAVGVGGEEHSRQGFEFLRHIACHAHVLLLIDGFELSVEETEHGVLETLRLDLCPVLHLVRWDVLGVACHVVRCKSIRSVGTDHGHHLVILVWDGILRSYTRDGVDDVVGCFAGSWVGECAIVFKKGCDGVEQGFLGLVVLSAELCSALEHQMFQIMCQAGSLGGIVLRTGAHGDVGLDAWLLLVDSH